MLNQMQVNVSGLYTICTPKPKKKGREKPHMFGLNHYLRVSSTVF